METNHLHSARKATWSFILVFLISIFVNTSVKAGNPLKTDTDRNTGTGAINSAKFLDLPIWQLKLIGLDGSSKGLFYKNQNPDWQKEKNRYQLLCFYLTDDVFYSNLNYHTGEEFLVNGKPQQILKNMETSVNAFDPVLLTDQEGKKFWDAFTVLGDKDMKLLPVRINMADLQMKKRNDWVVFWFKPTESLKKVLSPYVNIDSLLRVP